MTTPHRWQLEAITALLTILASSDYAYLQAPTGSGKTYEIVLLGEQTTIAGTRVVIVGTSRVANQHKKTLTEMGFRTAEESETNFWSQTGKLWIVNTWQGIAANPANFVHPQGCAVLFFDECHLGGRHANNKSYRKIVGALKPIKRVHVSATTNVASERLLGKREGASYVYTLSAAYEDDLLNPVNIIEIETGNTVMLERVEAVFGKSMEEVEELTDEKLSGLAHKLKTKGVLVPRLSRNPKTKEEIEATEGAKTIINNRHDAMINLYLAKHAGESAIFYCANIDAAKRAASTFAHRCDIRGATVHNNAGEVAEIIDQFEAGKITVIFAVQMLQEGFNMPRLRLAFDCRFHRQLNRYRIARMMQRIGRLTRKNEGKPVSLYYVAPDLTHYYTNGAIPNGSLLGAHVLAAGDALDPNDLTALVPIFGADPIELDTLENDEGEVEGGELAIAADAPKGESCRRCRVRGTVVPLYLIKAARGYTQGNTLSLGRLFADQSALLMEDYVRRSKAGEQYPKGADLIRLDYLRRSHPYFAAEVAAYGWKKNEKRAMGGKVAAQDRSDFLARALAGQALPTGAEAAHLRNHQRRNSAFDQQIEATAWCRNERRGGGAGSRDSNTQAGLDRLRAFDDPPPTTDTAARVLYLRWMKDPERSALLRQEKPHWFSSRDHARLVERGEGLLVRLLTRQTRPKGTGKVDNADYLVWKKYRDHPEFGPILRQKKPNWFGS